MSTSTIRPDLEPMPEDIRAWARGDDLVPAPEPPTRPVTAAAIFMAAGVVGLSAAAFVGWLVEVIG